MGIVQGLTEFLPISSSGHLIIVPFLFGWDDPFITSLAFSVMLHVGTLLALLVYFRADWVRLVPAGFAAIRDRSFGGDPDRRLAWLLVAATIPAALAGFLLNDAIEGSGPTPAPRRIATSRSSRSPSSIGAAILWLADRFGPRTKGVDDVTFPVAIGIGVAQAHRADPGHQPFGHLDLGRPHRRSRPRGSRPFRVPHGDADHGRRGPVRGPEARVRRGRRRRSQSARSLVGLIAAFVSGMIAISFMLSYLRTRSLNIFVVYRIVVAAVILIVWFARG